MLVPGALAPRLPGETAEIGGLRVEASSAGEAALVHVGVPPALPGSVSMVVATDGSVETEPLASPVDVAACRAYDQAVPPERPEIPKPVARRRAKNKKK
jgi:hypothetical protein